MKGRDNNLLILECPHCGDCHDVDHWNKEVANSVAFGRATELIPRNLKSDEWSDYAMKEGGLVDCPLCESVCNYEDMIAC